MSPRRSLRIRGKPKRLVQNGTITNTGPKPRSIARDATTLVSARKGRGGVPRGKFKLIPVTATRILLQTTLQHIQ